MPYDSIGTMRALPRESSGAAERAGKVKRRPKAAEKEKSTLERGDVAEGDRGEDRCLPGKRAFQAQVQGNINHPIRRLRRHLPYLGKVFIPSVSFADTFSIWGRLTIRRPSAAGLHSLPFQSASQQDSLGGSQLATDSATYEAD